MGAYINIGNAGFRSARNGEYVDKSGLIAVVNDTLNSKRRFSCVTRSRRFGKSMAAEMLCAYYDYSCDSRQLFDNLEISKVPSFEKHLNKYPVLYLDMTALVTRFHEKAIVGQIDAALKKDVRELPTGKGFADVVFMPRKNVTSPAIIFELKYDDSAESAIAQIKQKEYFKKLSEDIDDILLVGINYDRKNKKHVCQIEWWQR